MGEEVWDEGFMRIWYQWMWRDEDELVVRTWLRVRGISRQLGAGFFSLKDLKCLYIALNYLLNNFSRQGTNML